MASYHELVHRVIRESDVLLIVVDARNVAQSINPELEAEIIRSGKSYLYVINKVDLITKTEQSRIRLPHAVQVSAQKHWGTMVLMKRLARLAGGKDTVVGIVGYPNTGKSSVINALKGRHSARTSLVSGFTKALQKVRISRRLVLIDTPGIIPFHRREDDGNVLVGAVDVSTMKDPEGAVYTLMDAYPGLIEKHFGVDGSGSHDETLEQVALKNGILKRGGKADTDRMSRDIIRRWQKGGLKTYPGNKKARETFKTNEPKMPVR